MQELLSIILAIVINLIPGKVTEFTVQITDIEGGESVKMQVTKQADGGWKAHGEKALKDPVTYYFDSTKVTVKNGDKNTTEDLAKHLTIGATPFRIQHCADGLNFLVNAEENDSRVVKVRWEAEKK